MLVDSLCIICIECIKIVAFFVDSKSNFFFSYIRFFRTFPFSISLPIIILLRPTFLRCMTRLPTVPTLVGLYLAAFGRPMSWALTMITIQANLRSKIRASRDLLGPGALWVLTRLTLPFNPLLFPFVALVIQILY